MANSNNSDLLLEAEGAGLAAQEEVFFQLHSARLLQSIRRLKTIMVG